MSFADGSLAHGGTLLIKYLQGADEGELLDAARNRFAAVKVVKPLASRKASKEVYLLATGHGKPKTGKAVASSKANKGASKGN